MRNSRGSVLILVLWALSLLTVFTVSLSYSARQKASLLNRIETESALRDIAYSGVERARGILRMVEVVPTISTLNDAWAKNPAAFTNVGVGNGSYTVGKHGLLDEESKLNLNKADHVAITKLLQIKAKLTEAAAQELAYHIIDWRDSDSGYQHPSIGFEDSDYDDLREPIDAKDAPMELVEELLLVKGITRPIFDSIRDSVTVRGTGAVNVHTAPKEVLMAVGMSETLADRVLTYRRGDDGEDATADDMYFETPARIIDDVGQVQKLDAADENTVRDLVDKGKIDTRSSFFTARSKAVLTLNGATMEVEAVMDRKGKVYYARFSGIQWPSRA